MHSQLNTDNTIVKIERAKKKTHSHTHTKKDRRRTKQEKMCTIKSTAVTIQQLLEPRIKRYTEKMRSQQQKKEEL